MEYGDAGVPVLATNCLILEFLDSANAGIFIDINCINPLFDTPSTTCFSTGNHIFEISDLDGNASNGFQFGFILRAKNKDGSLVQQFDFSNTYIGVRRSGNSICIYQG